MQSIDRPRTVYEDYLAVPDTKVAEVIDGQLVVSPRPAVPHSRAASTIGQDLRPFDARGGTTTEPGGWWILFEPELRFGDDILVPDLAGWRRDRLAALPRAAHITQPPEWLCEVLSPGTAKLDRTRKLAIYGRAGVVNAWLVDPLLRTLEIYRYERGHWILVATHADVAPVRAEPFAAIELQPERWWLDAE